MSLGPLIDAYLVSREKEDNEGRTSISPSLIGYCSRRVAMSMLQYPARLPTPAELSVFDAGDSMHERYQRYFAKMGILVAKELPLNQESKNPRTARLCRRYRIRGRLDAIVRIKKELYVVELKSARESSYLRMAAGRPYEPYRDQLQLYMYLTGIGRGIILVENKNDQQRLEFPEEIDRRRVASLLNKISRINRHVLSLTLPEREHEKNSFECRYCEFSDSCWSEHPEEHIERNRDWLGQLLSA